MFYFFSGSYLSYILSCCNAFTCFHAVSDSLLFTHTCPVTEFAVASHLNTANSCCHHVFLRHFRFQKCLPVNSNKGIASERKKILRKTRYLGMMYICAHSREEESCRKRPRSARECARAHALFYGRRGDGCFLSVASVPA